VFRKSPRPYVLVIINDDGTGRVQYVTSPPSLREKILHGLFLNMMGDGAFKNVPPGRYRFENTKTRLWSHDYDLIPVD